MGDKKCRCVRLRPSCDGDCGRKLSRSDREKVEKRAKAAKRSGASSTKGRRGPKRT